MHISAPFHRASDLLLLPTSRAAADGPSKQSGHGQRRRDRLHLLPPLEAEPLLYAVVTVCTANAVAQEVVNAFGNGAGQT